jgi:selenobiotic family peptide radical SAM maturase
MIDQETKESTGASVTREMIDHIFPACRRVVDPDSWKHLCHGHDVPESIVERIALRAGGTGIPQFLASLARLEWILYNVKTVHLKADHLQRLSRYEVNPALRIVPLSWKNLLPFISTGKGEQGCTPEPGKEIVIVWRDEEAGEARYKVATDEDLLAIKIIVEGIDPVDVARQGSVAVGAIDAVIDRAAERGLILKPQSRLRRDVTPFSDPVDVPERFRSADVFTLQWHITQTCDLHCKHCYDRSDITPLPLEKGIAVLDDMRVFCRSRYVRGHITFTGGNPLLYPRFLELYREAADRGFSLAVLGNAAPKLMIEKLLSIKMPTHFQVSLEGLPEHNDRIRGRGYFDRVMKFLDILQDMDVYSMVMLTLTRDNIDQVLPLAEILRHRTDLFTFNRLSMVGEGANLLLPTKEQYEAFLRSYIKAARHNPVMGLKDNLINIILHEQGNEPFGGCAGFGCGAAFNFLSILPDGEAHACRKFPSPVGNIIDEGIGKVYDSEISRRYRRGCSACDRCSVRHVCGGCLAIAHNHGLDISMDRDPFCFIQKDRLATDPPPKQIK